MVFYRRRLPHWHPEDKTYFLTWRLYGTLPSEIRNRLAALRSTDPSSVRDFLDIDSLVDQAVSSPDWLGRPEIAGIVEDSLRDGDSRLKHYSLWAYVVMPNHVHVLLTPRIELERVTRRMKGFTARQANRILGRQGARFWQPESFDHWIRSDEEFSRTLEYIENNPVAAGLVRRKKDWRWSSAYQKP